MTDLNNKYIKHCQLETIKKRINELDSLLAEYMKDATEEEKQAIPLFHEEKQTGLIGLIRDYGLAHIEWISREDFETIFEIERGKIDDIIEKLDESIIYGDGSNPVADEIIENFKQ